MSERRYRVDGRPVRVVVAAEGKRQVACVDDQEAVLENVEISDRCILFTLDGRRHRLPFVRRAGRIHVGAGGHEYVFAPLDDDTDTEERSGFSPHVVAPMPGRILDVLVAEGDRVTDGQPLLLLEAMKMEQTIRAPGDAVVRSVRAETGAMVGPGDVLIVLEEPGA